MKVFVTGASGFVGGAVTKALAREHDVVALVRSDGGANRVRALGATPVTGDLDSITAEPLRGCAAVVHAAALAKPYGRPEEFRRVNVEGTQRLLDAARAAGVRRFVHVSTEAVCFDGKDLVGIDESTPLPTGSRYAYSTSKREAEQSVLAAAAPGRFEPVALRPSWVWGPGDTNALPMMVEMVKAGKFMWVDGGTAMKTTTHVENLVEAIRLALTRGTPGAAYFINDDEPMALKKFLTRLMATQGLTLPEKSVPGWLVSAMGAIAETIWRATGSRGKPAGTRLEAAFMRAQVSLPCERAKRELGYRPVVTIDEGMRRLESQRAPGAGN